MTTVQSIEPVGPSEMPARAAAMRASGWRLMQICATAVGPDFEILYSFAKGRDLQNFRATVPREGARLPSITGPYLCAFLYENEIHDLFGVEVEGNVLDFKGTFYKTAVPHPFVNDALPAPVSKK